MSILLSFMLAAVAAPPSPIPTASGAAALAARAAAAGPLPQRWDAHAHRTIVALALTRLHPATRARVDALIRRHPDRDSLAVGLDPATADGVHELLLRAAVWPDRIRSDPRFHDDRDSTPTPTLPGFPDMRRRSDWHYVDRAFSDDGTLPRPMRAPTTPQRIADALHALADTTRPAPERAYWLSWILHVVGDLHQPLHGTSRATRAEPEGDAGGNRLWVRRSAAATDSVRLHAVWDGAFSAVEPAGDARAAAARVAAVHPATPLGVTPATALARADSLVQLWADESATLAQHVAYAVGPRAPTDPPVALDAAYWAVAGRVAVTRVAQAADRLAAVLEGALGER